MNEADGEIARFRRVLCYSSCDKTRCLYEIHPLFQRFDEARNCLWIILVVTVNGNDSFIALIECKSIGAAKLSAQFAWTRLHQQSANSFLLQ